MLKRLSYHVIRSFSSSWYWARRRFSQTGIFIIISLCMTASVGLDTNMTMAYQAFVLMFCIFTVSVSWCITTSLFQKRKHRKNTLITAERHLPRFGTVGEPIEYQIVLYNLSDQTFQGVGYIEDLSDPRPKLDPFLKANFREEKSQSIIDRTFGFYRWSRMMEQNRSVTLTEKKLSTLPAKKESRFSMDITPHRRGYIRFNGITLAKPDIFGLVRNLTQIPQQQSLLILPKRYSLPDYPLPGRQQYQQGGVALASSVGESEEFVALRDYRPGDPLRRIHWRSWARTGKPVVKEYQDEFFVRHALILDTFLDNASDTVFEEAISLAASFACTIQTQDSLLDLMFVGTEAFCFTTGRGVSQTEKMLEILASVSPCSTEPFETLRSLVIQHISDVSGCICILLGWDERRKNLVQLLKSFSIPLNIFVITEKNEKEIDPGPMGDNRENFHILRSGRVQEDLKA